MTAEIRSLGNEVGVAGAGSTDMRAARRRVAQDEMVSMLRLSPKGGHPFVLSEEGAVRRYLAESVERLDRPAFEIGDWDYLTEDDRRACIELERDVFIDAKYNEERELVRISVGPGVWVDGIGMYTKYNDVSTFVMARSPEGKIVGVMRKITMTAHERELTSPTVENATDFKIPESELTKWESIRGKIEDIATLSLDRGYRGDARYTMGIYKLALADANKKKVSLWTMVLDHRLLKSFLTFRYNIELIGEPADWHGSPTFPLALEPGKLNDHMLEIANRYRSFSGSSDLNAYDLLRDMMFDKKEE